MIRQRNQLRLGPKPNPLAVLLIFALLGSAAQAQFTPKHFQQGADMPPGVIGRELLTRGGQLNGYYQPVELVGPPGVRISLVVNGQFEKPQSPPVIAGMLIGQVYRCKVTGIPDREGYEVFPTIEVIDRLYPPPGQKNRFPIPIHLTREELHMALDGLYVTRIVYLEDPVTAFPEQDEASFQRYYETQSAEDPLHVADRFGRPMAILRIGSRIPNSQQSSLDFVYGSPPLIKLPRWRKAVVGELISVEPASKPPSN